VLPHNQLFIVMAEKSSKAYGFIGLGVMGRHMAENLATKLPSTAVLYVYDISKDAVDGLCKHESSRVHACSNAAEVATKSDVIMSMVPEGSHVRSVYLDEDKGVINSDLTSKLLIDFSTIDTATSLLVKDKVAEKFPDASFYDAPVSGGPIGAEKATLTIMLGCAETDPNLPRLRELIGLMGKEIVACGGPSLGLTAKLCNNYCSGLINIATAEAYNIAIRSGLDPKLLKGIFSTSTAQSCIGDKFNPVPNVIADSPANRGYSGGFKIQLMRKDFNLAVDMAERVGAKLELGQAGLKTYTDASQDQRCRDLDSRVIYRYIGGDEEWEKRFKS